jgi:hypothetical protein
VQACRHAAHWWGLACYVLDISHMLGRDALLALWPIPTWACNRGGGRLLHSWLHRRSAATAHAALVALLLQFPSTNRYRIVHTMKGYCMKGVMPRACSTTFGARLSACVPVTLIVEDQPEGAHHTWLQPGGTNSMCGTSGLLVVLCVGVCDDGWVGGGRAWCQECWLLISKCQHNVCGGAVCVRARQGLTRCA